MTMTNSHRSHRRLDAAGLALLLIGLLFGALSYWLVTQRDYNPLAMVPSIVAATTGASHVSKRQAPRH
jgi:hypothetical protein